MKKQSFRLVTRTVFAAGIACILLLAQPASAKAATEPATTTSTSANVQYIGTDNNRVWFQVNYANPRAEQFDLVIRDEAGSVLYKQRFSDKSFSKKIMFVKEEGSSIKPTFTFSSASGVDRQTFSIASRTVEEVVVTKL